LNKITLIIVLSFLIQNCNPHKQVKNIDQSALDKDCSKIICNCLDSLNERAGSTQNNFPDCFSLALDRNYSEIMREFHKSYSDTTQATLTKFTNELEIRFSILLIHDCTTFFELTDSLYKQQYKDLNKDSLKILLQELQTRDITKRNNDYYEYAGMLYFQLGIYDEALENVEKVLSKDSTRTKSLFIKASIDDKNGNYQEAIFLYEKIAKLSNKIFYIYSEMAKRKQKSL